MDIFHQNDYRGLWAVRLAVLLLPVLLAGCVSSTKPALTPAELVTLLSGTYSNAAQRSELPDEIATRYTPDAPWLDTQYAIFAPVKVPAMGENTLYLQWHRDNEDGPIIRQRIWQFEQLDAQTVAMRFYALKKAAAKASLDAHKYPERVQDFAKHQLIVYPDNCVVVWRRVDKSVVGEIAPGCSITAYESGRSMTLHANIVVNDDGLTYRESGVLDEGSYAFLVPGYQAYEFKRLGGGKVQ